MTLKEMDWYHVFPWNKKHLNISPLTYNGEVTKMTWPQVIDIKKIWDIQVVGTDALMYRWKFQISQSITVALARSQTFLEVGSRDLDWWPDLTWPGVIFFTQCVQWMYQEVCQVWGNLVHRRMNYVVDNVFLREHVGGTLVGTLPWRKWKNGKNGGAVHRRFTTIGEKPGGGSEINPPPAGVRGLTWNLNQSYFS